MIRYTGKVLISREKPIRSHLYIVTSINESPLHSLAIKPQPLAT